MRNENKNHTIILHDRELDAAVSGLEEIKMERLDPIILPPVTHYRKTRPIPVGATQVTLDMIYGAILSLARAVENLSPSKD